MGVPTPRLWLLVEFQQPDEGKKNEQQRQQQQQNQELWTGIKLGHKTQSEKMGNGPTKQQPKVGHIYIAI